MLFRSALQFIGFGTMNGPDGKPFKTRDGGVLRLEYLLKQITDKMYEKIRDNKELPEEEAKSTAEKVALAAVKYGDLSNQASKDYIFDIERFTSFEGDTGPYILYTMVRMKSILNKYREAGGNPDTASCMEPSSKVEKELMMDLAGFNAMLEEACAERAPHKVCAFIYQAANDINSFYHAVKILTEEDSKKQEGYIALLNNALKIMEICIGLLGFEAPERM